MKTKSFFMFIAKVVMGINMQAQDKDMQQSKGFYLRSGKTEYKMLIQMVLS